MSITIETIDYCLKTKDLDNKLVACCLPAAVACKKVKISNAIVACPQFTTCDASPCAQ